MGPDGERRLGPPEPETCLVDNRPHQTERLPCARALSAQPVSTAPSLPHRAASFRTVVVCPRVDGGQGAGPHLSVWGPDACSRPAGFPFSAFSSPTSWRVTTLLA